MKLNTSRDALFRPFEPTTTWSALRPPLQVWQVRQDAQRRAA